MDNNSKELYKNIGEAVVDTVMTALGVATFGVSTNLVDFGEKVFTHYQNSKKIHAIKQLKYFYDTPSRLLAVNLQDFKEKHADYEEIVLDLLKTLDLTIHKKQSEMLARLMECFILDEIDEKKFHQIKNIVVKLDQHLIYKLEEYLPNDDIAGKKFDLEYEFIGLSELYEGRTNYNYSQEERSYDFKVSNFLTTTHKNVPQELINSEFYTAIDIPLTSDQEKLPQQQYKPTILFLWFITHIFKDNNQRDNV